MDTAPPSHHHNIHHAVPAKAAPLTSPPEGKINKAARKPTGPPHKAMAVLGIMA
jgi:hypothetical protein